MIPEYIEMIQTLASSIVIGHILAGTLEWAHNYYKKSKRNKELVRFEE